MTDDRRYFERSALKLPMLIRSVADNSVVDAQTNDLGAKGLGIYSKNRLPQRGEVKLQVEIPGESGYLSLAGNIVWSKEYYPDGWRAGIGLKEQSINLVAFSVLLDRYLGKSAADIR